VFRTLQPDCLLLLAAYPPEILADYDAKDIKGNFSISLVDGQLHVWVNSGRSFVKMSSNSSQMNDGEFHVVNLIKTGRKLELMVDDELQETRNLNGNPTVARHFNGLGYAQLMKTRPRPTRKNLFSVQMTFRTLDENALLFLAVDDKNVSVSH